jgi:hypothetical protein
VLRNSRKFSNLMEDMRIENERYFLGTPINEMYPKVSTKPFRFSYGRNLREKSRKESNPTDNSLFHKRPTTTADSGGLRVNVTSEQPKPRKPKLHDFSSPKRWSQTLNSPRESSSNLRTTPCSNIILPCSSSGCIIDPRLLTSAESASKLGMLEEISVEEFHRKCSAAKRSSNIKNMLYKHFENRGLFREVVPAGLKDFHDGPYLAGYVINQEKIGKIITETKVHNIHLLKKLEERKKIKSSISSRKRTPL